MAEAPPPRKHFPGYRWLQQFCALFRKNALVAWRNRRATILRLVAPFFFLLLALLVETALNANAQDNERFKTVSTPSPRNVSEIPSCNEDLYIGKRDCYDFFYTPLSFPGNDDLKTIINGIIANNGNRPINASRVRGFAARADVDKYMLANPDTVLAAVHFWQDPLTLNVHFVLQTNTTVKYFKGDFQDPNMFVQVPLMSAVQREIAKLYLTKQGKPDVARNLKWIPVFYAFPHPALDSTSIVGFVLGPFIFAACLFGFVTQIGSIVSEKELGLRQALRNMGMKDSTYWTSWMIWDICIGFVAANLICIFGLIMQFDMFLKNSYGILFFLFFLFQMAMSSFAYFLSVFLSKTAVAVYTGFAIFIVGWIMQTVVIFGVPFSPQYSASAGGNIYRFFSALPWNLLAKGVLDLGAATSNEDSPGIQWNQRSSYCQNIEKLEDQPNYDPKVTYYNFACVMPLSDVFGVMVLLWVVYLVAAIYLDNVVPNENGVARPFYYFLLPDYWFPRVRDSRAALNKVYQDDQKRVKMPPPEPSADDDVQAEEDRMRAVLNYRTGKGGESPDVSDRRCAVELFGLRKVFRQGGGCCRRSNRFWAIKGSWFAIEENSLFCLLGPNGAGKTTTINCLTGVLPYTGGDALVYGQSISSEGGMDQTRSIMGVCPQFDILWAELSGREHLEIYGHVKGIEWKQVPHEATRLLEKVKLTYAEKQRSGAYSGGMKRRLSVAIALLGDPKIVYLDEPTTGMDPISRRYVWDIIQESKAGRAIVLTTHSMEEADILGDRIAIMARGRLRCLANSIRLKQKFGAGYQVSVSVMSARGSQQDLQALAQRAERVKAFFKQSLDLEPVEESKAYINFLVERRAEAALIAFLPQLEEQRAELGVTDVQLSLTSLEEVFLTIARQAELEAAATSGRNTVQVPLSDGTMLTVPLGEQYVLNPATNKYYQVKWATDEAGKLSAQDAVEIDASRIPATSGAPGSAGAAPPDAPIPRA